MSHDRGCPCGREFHDEYEECDRPVNKCFRSEYREKKEKNGKD